MAANKVLVGRNVADEVAPSKAAGKDASDEYQKLSQLDHILVRPDTYIGSIEPSIAEMLVFDADRGFVTRQISYVPGLFKIFDEIMVNAADNKQRDASMDLMQVVINSAGNEISILNTGRGIPVELHKKEKVYIPEMIFGHLLTGSNFNDDERKVTGGRNGFGAKLCNIFSSRFVIETCDSSRGLKYKQVFSDNMRTKGEPQISKASAGEKDFTKVTFSPDLAKFGLSALDEDHVALLTRRVWDVAATTSGVKVMLNGERIPVRCFHDYVKRVLKDQGIETPVVHEKVNDRWEVAFTISENGFQQISFVNSIATTKGGTHVKYIEEQISDHLMKAIAKKNKHAPVKQHQIRQHMYLFVNALVENPSFDSQTKENMTRKAKDFGSTCALSDAFLKNVGSSGIVDSVLHFAKLKSEAQMSRSHGGSKKTKITGIPKLDDANEAGGRNSHKCTLILTEGDSAKALAVSGLGIVGRDYYGVFPLRGKLLNVRDANHKQIMENAEIKHICQIMGLKFQTTYDSVKSLRYGRLMIMADQDQDGSHIKGLLINFIHHYWPSLLQLEDFLVEFVTPIVKVSKGKTEKSFFTLPQYEAWCAEQPSMKGWKIKYYKGLGTSTPQEAKEYFSNMDTHQIPFCFVDQSDFDAINMAFNKKAVEQRKDWLRALKPGTFLDHSQDAIRYADFINKELILFSMADNVRSIPSVMDGFKPGQRKVLFSCFKRNLVAEIKVAQLAGYVAEHSSYHHGEQSLAGTIVNMAQNFVGSNNLNLLMPNGQFGTRLQGGKDAASARYIFTLLSPLARKLFHASDDDLLTYLEDDGVTIEPEFYVPILPMVLVNGSDGIGTGWSSTVPNYNPREIATNLLQMIAGEEPQEMCPWYKGFKGEILPSKDKFTVRGCLEKTSETTLEILELPVSTWTQTYKEFLETLQEEGKKGEQATISDFTQHHTDTTVRFVVTMTPEQMLAAEAKGLHKVFKLETTLSTSNMTLFDSQHRIRKYESVCDILQEFYDVRLRLYQQRKALLAERLQASYEKLDNKVRFINAVISGTLVLSNRKRSIILADLIARGFRPFPKTTKGKPAVAGSTEDTAAGGAEDEEMAANEADTPGVNDFDYLLGMPLWNLTEEKVAKLEAERSTAEQELATLLGKSPQDLWQEDLKAFLEELDQCDAAETEADGAPVVKAKGGSKSAAAKAKRALAPKTATAKSKADYPSGDEGGMNDDEDEDWQPQVKSKPAAVSLAAMQMVPTKSAKPATNKVTSKPATLAAERAPKHAASPPREAQARPTKIQKPSAPKAAQHELNSEEEDTELGLKGRLALKMMAAKPSGAKAKSSVSSQRRETPQDELFAGDGDDYSAPPLGSRPKRAATKAPIVVSEEEEEEESVSGDDEAVSAKVNRVPKVAAATSKPKPKAAGPKAGKAATKPAAPKSKPSKATVAKAAPRLKPKAKSLLSSDDEALDEPTSVVVPAMEPRDRSRRAAAAAPKSYRIEDEEDVDLLDAGDDDDDDEYVGEDDGSDFEP